MHEITVRTKPATIPEYFEVDLTGLEIGHSVHLSTLKVPEGVRVVSRDKNADRGLDRRADGGARGGGPGGGRCGGSGVGSGAGRGCGSGGRCGSGGGCGSRGGGLPAAAPAAGGKAPAPAKK